MKESKRRRTDRHMFPLQFVQSLSSFSDRFISINQSVTSKIGIGSTVYSLTHGTLPVRNLFLLQKLHSAYSRIDIAWVVVFLIVGIMIGTIKYANRKYGESETTHETINRVNPPFLNPNKYDENNHKLEEEYDEDEVDFDFSRKYKVGPDSLTDHPIFGKTDRYEWSQTKKEIEVYIPLSRYGQNISAMDLDVHIRHRHMSIRLRGQLIFKEDFPHGVRESDACWVFDKSIDGFPHIWLNLTKQRPTTDCHHYWKSLFKNGPEIDVRNQLPPAMICSYDKIPRVNASKSVNI
jgi:hypothetical protein